MTKPEMIDCGPLNVLVNARHGRMLVNRHDIYIGRSIQTLGEFSEAEVDLFRQVVRPGALVVEAGANIGTHTVPLAQLTGPTGHVWAIEPQRIVFQTLCANLALNSLTNVTAIWAAVGKEPGQLFVPSIDYSTENNFGGLGLEGRTQGEAVNVLTIDSLRLPRLDLIKADVEGMEQVVLEGAQQTIQRCRPLLYVENDRSDKSDSLVQCIKQMGYAAYAHIPRLYSETNFFGETNNPFGNIVSVNLFAVHESVAANIQGLKQL
ncbi:MAG: FkbM family methyltransferase [Pirellulaceae bacterium]|nr:FkbM family methyltransferase [Pirellulaceae bacterium]